MPTQEQIQKFIEIREKRQRMKAYKEKLNKKRQERMADDVLIEGHLRRKNDWRK